MKQIFSLTYKHIWPATNLWLFRSPFVWWKLWATIFGCVCMCAQSLSLSYKSFWNWNVFCAPIFISSLIIFSFQSNGWHFFWLVQPACLLYSNTNIVCCCCRYLRSMLVAMVWHFFFLKKKKKKKFESTVQRHWNVYTRRD